jgi:hypothetical protein
VSIDPVALGCRACIDLHSLVDLSCSGGFLKEQMRGFHDLMRQKTNLSVHIVGMELNLSGLNGQQEDCGPSE